LLRNCGGGILSKDEAATLLWIAFPAAVRRTR